ncbi:MAG: recombinase family protein [Phycisphaeraceae bacterium]|nr:recombinase family protein [Phycisphaeraceae bacterium]MCW5763628.1 recombinase family protein [Phycisphaeraceae bacterium]
MTRSRDRQSQAEPPKTIRCAIYTRKSTEDGLEQEFNSLDAQRESGEVFIASQKSAGWVCSAERYDDGGFSGGTAERPALQRLLDDIKAGLVDCVVVYKVDRLSRSLLDFARMMETFERHGVSFVSVTQQFNTAHSMGRLTLNILLSFAQFEREIISERTRDKIAAARKKGKWAGGRPVLGYDLEPGPGGSKLKVNHREAERVRAIYELYLAEQSLLRTSAKLNDRGWTTKRWVAKNGQHQGGRRFDKAVLHKMLTNPVYIGRVRHHDELYDGEHEAILDEDVFRAVGELLSTRRARDGRSPCNKHGALLKGLVRCRACQCAMGHHFASCKLSGGGTKRYQYYVCSRAQKEGWAVCPGPSLPAAELESFVINELRAIGRDDGLVADAMAAAQRRLRERLDVFQGDRAGLAAEVEEARRELRDLVADGRDRNGSASLAADLRERIRDLDARGRKLDARLTSMRERAIDEDELAGALESFDPLWEQLNAAERERLVRLLVKCVEWDAVTETVTVTFNADSGVWEEDVCLI